MNILGQHLEPVLKNEELLKKGKLFLYGKAEAKINRKMGHITFFSDEIEELLTYIESTQIWNV